MAFHTIKMTLYMYTSSWRHEVERQRETVSVVVLIGMMKCMKKEREIF